MHQDAGDGDLQFFAGGEALGAAVDDCLHIEHGAQGVDLFFEHLSFQAMQTTVIADVLPTRQALIDPPRVGKDPDPPLDLERGFAHVESVYLRGAAIGSEQCIQHAQGGALARAVRA